MTPTCLDAVTYSMRQARLLRPGREPKAAEAEEGMVALQALYDQWRTGGMFGRLEDIYLDSNDFAEEGKRYYVPNGITLTAPSSEYVDGCGVTRQPRDLALYEALLSDGTHIAKLYDRTEWVDLLGLQLADAAPLGGRNVYGLSAALALSGGFVSMFGGDVPQTVVSLSGQFVRNLSSKHGSTQNDRHAEYM